MVLTSSKIIPLGFEAPNFNLYNPHLDKYQSLDELKSNTATVIVFMCNHCPYVVHILNSLVQISNIYMKKSVAFIAINSNDISAYPDDSPEKMIDLVKNYGIRFPYLFDESQSTAKLYNAACTPDFNIFNKELKCVYRGQYDDSRPGKKNKPDGNDIISVLELILKNKEIPKSSKPSIGCNIKWK